MRCGRGRGRGLLLGAVLVILAPGCRGDAELPVVLVDFSHDEFATQFLQYFPDTIQAHAGDTIRFRQIWTGEPHTVTFGSAVAPVLEVTQPLLAEYGDLPYDEVPPDAMSSFMEAESTLPHFWPMEEPEQDAEVVLNQTVGQPCVIGADQELPMDGSPCEDQELAPFTGTETLYNSGVIPYEGPGGNVFELELADTIAPGSYPFVCAVHGSMHSGVLDVVPDDVEVPSPRDVSDQAREVVNAELAPLRSAFEQARAEGEYERNGTVFAGNFAGLLAGEMDGVVNEFVPRDLEVRVGEPVTWTFFGPHSVSFEVPAYLPIIEWQEDGTVTQDEALYAPAGGAPEPPEPEGPGQPLVVDGGTYDGEGFWSSGVLSSDAFVEYTLRFSEPGEYPYACLIHPPMVGTVRVVE